MTPSEQIDSGPREWPDEWCCSCGVWKTEDNGLQRCSVSHARMQAMDYPGEGLTHLWAKGTFTNALRIWNADENVRARLTLEHC